MICRFSWNVLSADTKEPVNATGSSARVWLPFKIPKGRKGALTHHPLAGGGTAFGSRALSEGDTASSDAFSQCRPACGHVGHRLRG